MLRPLPASFAVLLLLTPLSAEDLGGGKTASHGRVPRFVLDSWLPGKPTAFRFVDLPSPGPGIALLSTKGANLQVPGIGTLVVDITSPAFFAFVVNGSVLLQLPRGLDGASLYIQGVYLDKNQAGLTDGTRVDVFTPVAMVGNQRQSANSLSVIDIQARAVTQRLPNSENGYITFSSDRRFAYVCEPGSQRNRVVFYDLSRRPITVRGTASVSGGIRYGCDVSRDGKRLYAPVHDGVAVVDSDPTSTTFMKELFKISTKITGNSGTILTGPLDVAVTPDGRKLYVSHGEKLVYPAKSHVSVIDLTKTPPTEKLIPITTGGTLRLSASLEFATHPRIKVSLDGLWVYVCEWGVDPAKLGQFVRGFANGGLVKAIFTPIDQEFAVVPTQGFQASELAVDRMQRNVWVAQLGRGGYGEVLRVDIDKHSTQRFKGTRTLRIDPVAYQTGGGPLGIDTTPDGALVYVSVAEDSAHRIPQVVTIDALTNKVVGAPIRVESLCATLRIQQR
ncbi:MAG: hypothetical protein CMJ85_13700 [Planctomycetes bacterium]|jgi:DNA-binding beta-propeller fold protein YncE|nr:hypothetical protein [Planctomycetota bacterium]MDP6423467.1 hypothetical protein [Planctomycetota bacterium]